MPFEAPTACAKGIREALLFLCPGRPAGARQAALGALALTRLDEEPPRAGSLAATSRARGFSSSLAVTFVEVFPMIRH